MDENPLMRGSSQPQLKNLEGWRCHPLLNSPVLRVETGPGHAGIDGHAALHLNPLPNYIHGGHNLCLQLSSPFDH